MPHPRIVALLLASQSALALCGCSSASPLDASEASVEQSAMAASEAAHPVRFKIGPNRFVLPSNWFIDGRGPDFQGNVTLALHWPSLDPYPPGQPYSSFTTGPMRNQRVVVSIDYIDRVPIDELPERYVTPQPGQDASDPSNNIPLRQRLPDRYGLEVYRTDLDKVALYAAKEMQRPPRPPEAYVGADSDWFIGRDADGRIRTVVMCEDQRVPEGFEIRGESLASIPASTRWPLCNGHRFSIPEFSIAIDAAYHRPIVRDWQRIEAAIRDALKDAHQRARASPNNGAPRQ